jgi:polyisoprenoid-binding protein YceI
MTNQTKWSIDQTHSDISFKIRHLMIAHVKGSFKKFDVNIMTSGKDFTTAVVDLWIDVSSLDTGDEKRDAHLKSYDFLDVEHHKQITFVSSTMGKMDLEDDSELWGELTIRGITKNVKLDVHFGGIMQDLWGNEKVGFTVTGKINRNDWEIIWNSTLEVGGLLVGEEISITCEIELTNVTAKETKIISSFENKKVAF